MATLKVPVTPVDHIQGSDRALVTLVEYGDFECPFCGEAYPIVKHLQKHFGDQLRFVFRDFPLKEIHPYAEAAAETAEWAATFNRFWEVHDLIYENQKHLNSSFLLALADQLGLSSAQLERAWQRKIYEPKIQEEFLGGVRSGVNGTPTFFINGQRYNGPAEVEDLRAAIEAQLARAS